MTELSHVDDEGRARMVDISAKPPAARIARASGSIALAAETIAKIKANSLKKGDVLAVAQIAGIQAAKRTGDLIPLCHPLALSHVDVKAAVTNTGVSVICTVKCTGPTGVEMEALAAVCVALLTVYDMCKAVDKGMRIGEIHLEEKVKNAAQ